jgi:hypothetical protein
MNLDMGGYIDSLFALQQSMIVELLESGSKQHHGDRGVRGAQCHAALGQIGIVTAWLSQTVPRSICLCKHKYYFSDSTYSNGVL